MHYHRLALPHPFYRLDVFSLREKITDDSGNKRFVTRLYVAADQAEGGRILLKELSDFQPVGFQNLKQDGGHDG